MESILGANSDFIATCERAADILGGFDGYFIERLQVDSSYPGGRVDVFLRIGTDRPDVAISLTGIVGIFAENLLEMDASFVEGMTVECIPGAETLWPRGLERLGCRPSGFPDVARLVLAGPMALEVIARTISISVAQVY
ncbi:hypothetical protein [Kitasatospora sp. NPDC098663]|uniref:hypothetical protein n=1 Tax=Kitasatospora sp. NPDC098663 TaxID=3364096 RepID=UPI00380ED9FE